MTRNMESAIAMLSTPGRQSHRCRVGVFTSSADCRPDRRSFDAELVSQISKRNRIPCDVESDRVSLVSILLCSRGPSAVFGAVMTVVVDAFYRVLVARPKAHVSEEVGERQYPRLRHRDSSSAIAIEGGILRVQAPLLDSSPDVVFGQEMITSGATVSRISGSRQVATEASATVCASAEFLGDYFRRVSAIASATPDDSPRRAVRSFNNGESSEPLTHAIDQGRHRLIIAKAGAW
jgi:hypothetical protein